MSDVPEIPTYPHVFTEGDRLPEIKAVLKDVDLTGYTVQLHLLQPDDTLVTRTAIPVALTDGSVKFDWAVGNLVAGSKQLCEIEFVDSGSRPMTSRKFFINVEKGIA